MNWTTTDGRSWSITVGDKTASIRLWSDNTTYGACVWQINHYPTTLTNLDTCNDIKVAKKACLGEIERINTQEEADKPKPPVTLRGEMYKTEHITYHETVAQAALAAYWAIERNDFMPCKIECEGEIVWKNHMITSDEYPTLASLAGIEDES